MEGYTFICPKCGKEFEDAPKDWKCPYCGSSLNLAKKPKIFRYRIMGEGNTPLVKEKIGGKELFFKLEYLNPTGSFKDRGTSATVQYFLKKKCSSFIEDSSGNTGISTAVYARRVNRESYIFSPKTIAESKKKLLNLLGAKLTITETREEAFNLAVKMAKKYENACYIGHMVNPIFNYGMSFLVEEVLKKTIGITDVIVPLASGTLLLGIFEGFKRNIDKNGGLPKIWAVQPTRTGYLRGKVKIVHESQGRSDSADALVVSNPARINDIINAINETKGGGIIVDDEDIKEGMRNLYSRGFIVEPSSSVVWKAFELLNREELIGSKILIPLTGSGLKYLHSI
ncbi:threonine synthase [Fervidicoccus fontis]|uniref:Threonine synthase n=1 Tax=Fervidicoccus fontis (strain DSM 19380 / JCM 18336 / VKM B-2539 / Kam940) TaxID=1163730 RepID=I0A2F0_FERFK|nr:pyridoxal-phosphate dependent enzyme [Fervidicoccus fontis]AFH43157.1 Threonine synthase [Fervidicoccus fontis Kam940]